MRLFSNRSQMTSKCGKNKKVAHEPIAEFVTDVFTTSSVIYLTIRLWARDFYRVIVDEGAARVDYREIEIESE